ncbi:MAG TPA: hypothetical protein VE153_19560 [Myxococcus sp.]|nr:hypothetical protein [Myxococcus sp.]
MKRQLAILAMTALFALGCGGAAADTSTEPVATEAEVEAAAGAKCGAVTCGDGEKCCNAECGLCVARGSVCPLIGCVREAAPAPAPEVEAAAGKQCGSNVCGAGERCCSQACGVCTSTNVCPLICSAP